jgi:hypothetical protein
MIWREAGVDTPSGPQFLDIVVTEERSADGAVEAKYSRNTYSKVTDLALD